VNPVDLGAVAILVLAALLGFRSGALPQLGGLLGAVAGAVCGLALVSLLAEPLAGIIAPVRALTVLAGLLVLVITGETFGATLGGMAARRIAGGLATAADRAAGAVVGAAQGLLILWLAGWLLAAGAIPAWTSTAQSSVTVRMLAAAVPPPTALTGQIAGLLDSTGLPDLFVGLDPLPALPVELPSTTATDTMAAAAKSVTFRVEADTCDVVSSGSSVLIATSYVVTNAHVIAGASAITVDGSTGPLKATAVLFDPELDVAVLRVPGLDGKPLRFATADPARGAVGATIGYPGGGALAVEPAAVTARLTATGLDVSGQHQVTREVLELRAIIRRGDSGGPFVVADGSIGGLVFAESRVDPNVGYALSPVAVATAVMPAVGRTSSVGVGSCQR
jgi:S1-C subfamily serine protease